MKYEACMYLFEIQITLIVSNHDKLSMQKNNG